MRFEIFLAVSVHIAITLILEALFLDAPDPAAHSTASRPLRTLVAYRIVADRVFDFGYCTHTIFLHPNNLRNFANVDRQTSFAANGFDVSCFLILIHATL